MRPTRSLSAILGAAVAAALVGSMAQPAQAETVQPWDFNGDGYPETVTKHPYADTDGLESAGAVAVFSGTPDGPTRTDPLRLTQGSGPAPGSPQEWESFGYDVTSGNFDGDGYADLIVCTDNSAYSVGDVTVLFGGSDGFTDGIALDVPDLFGCNSAASADIDQDGYDDLVFGHTRGLGWAAGGADARTQQDWPSKVLDGRAEEGVNQVAVGDMNGDQRPDIAYAIRGSEERHYVQAQLSTPDGFETSIRRSYYPDDSMAVTVGDIDGDGFGELGVGHSGESNSEGRVDIYRGARGGPDLESPPQKLRQSTSGIPGTSEDGDSFGSSVSLDDADGDGHADLAIGVPGEDVHGVVNAGRIVTVPGSARGLKTSDAVGIHQGTPGIPGTNEKGDEFGRKVIYRAGLAAGSTGLVVRAFKEDSDEGRTYVLGDDRAWWFSPRHADVAPSNG